MATSLNLIAWLPWAWMWALAFAIYCGCKALTWFGSQRQGVPLTRQLGFLLAWPGLDAAAFFDSRELPAAARPTLREWRFAWIKLAVGTLILWAAARFVPMEYPYATGWVGMVGIVMTLHFGVFHLLSCSWRSAGVNARPIMIWPLASKSLSEFWGRRWNTSFRDLTHRYLFRPLTPRLGARGAVLAGYLFSGLIHDVVISGPAQGGYGGPTLFFLLQAMAMLIERTTLGRRLGLGTGWRGWLYTMTVLLVPLPLLFHPPFVTRIVVPFMHATGAI